MRRWDILRPHFDDGVSLVVLSTATDVPMRTLQRWSACYRQHGLAGLARQPRADLGVRRLPAPLVTVVEALALRRPAPSTATVTRWAGRIAAAEGWPVPSYSSVRSIIAALDPAMQTLAHDGAPALRDRYELVYRRRADRPNAMWQADHTEADMLVLDDHGAPARPWLSVVLDDHSRAVAGYTVSLGAPSALNTSLTLRHAIWRKPDPIRWPVHGLPDVLYVDHGSDFISHHLRQVAADLHIELIHSAVGRPQGRGKVERFLGTVTTEVLPHLPGHLLDGRAATAPTLSLTGLDQAIGRWLTDTYHQRIHPETRQTPLAAWLGEGWLPRTPNSLDALDLLLVAVAIPRTVHRDGIRFEGQRYLDPTLAAYVGQQVSIRYDPRDLTEIKVFHHDRLLCRAVNDAHADQHLSLDEIRAARTARRRELRTGLTARRTAARPYTAILAPTPALDTGSTRSPDRPTPPPPPMKRTRRLAVYYEDRP